jgi:predicted dehydrogenase
MQIPCAIIGLGRIGSLLEQDRLREKPCTHAGAIVDNPSCILVGGYDTNPERRRVFSETWRVPADFPSAEGMLEALRPEIVHIATHPDSHASYVEMAARYGVKVAVCEKPLADTQAHARTIVRLHRTQTITVLTNHERRYSADYILAKQKIHDLTYGNLLSIHGRLYFGRKTPPAKQLIHDGTHLVDAIAFLTGSYLTKPIVHGHLHSKKGTVYIYARTRKPSLPVMLEVGTERDHLVFELTLSFSRGRIEIGNGVFKEYLSVPSPYYEGYRSLQLQDSPLFQETGYFRNMMADAVACTMEPGREPISSAIDGAEALRFIFSLDL